MPETLMEKLARAERELAESVPGHRVETFQTSSRWVKEHAYLVNYRGVEGHRVGSGLHG